MALKNLPKICPSCGKRLSVQAMHCNGCDTHIEGDYNLPVMMQLSAPDQQFVLDFVKSSGSLKEMAQKLGLSYPTVRNRLDDIIAQLNQFEGDEQGFLTRLNTFLPGKRSAGALPGLFFPSAC